MKRASTIRLSEEAWQALERLAAREGRSMSSWLEWTVRQKALEIGAWSPKVVSKRNRLDTKPLSGRH